MTAVLTDLFCLENKDPSNDQNFDRQAFDLSLLGSDHYARQKSKLIEAMHYGGPLPEPEKTSDELIADALNSLSLAEREQVFNDVSGVGNLNDENESAETTEFIEEHLQSMDQELKQQREGSSWSLGMAALDLAESQNPVYVQNPKFRLKFLLSENWNALQAAIRFIRHFDWKLELFGEGKLTKDIGLDDLEAEDIKMMKKGYMQRLPSRDRAGRAIVCLVFNGQQYASPESMARQIFFLGSNIDDETARRGVVFVTFKIQMVRFAKFKSITSFVDNGRAGTDLPFRLSVIHKFLEVGTPGIPRIHRLIDSSLSLLNPSTRARLRLTHGSHTEWMYHLMTLGIPHHLIPFTADYKIKTKNHLEYLAMRKTASDYRGGTVGAVQMTDLPTNKDVLLGKGKPIQESRGNIRLAAIIDDHVAQYHSSSKQEKTALASSIVHKIKASKGKFLSKESGIWIEVSDDVARDKVSHMFRHQRQKGNKTCQEMTGNKPTIRPLVGPDSTLTSMNTHLSKRIKV